MFRIQLIFKNQTSVETRKTTLAEAIDYAKDYNIAMKDIYFKNPIAEVHIKEED